MDGRISIVDMALPTMNGEKIVLRLLDRNASIQSVYDIGFSKSNPKKVLNLIDVPQGIILATGRTGSGKTTTLYSLMQHGVTPGKNYITLGRPHRILFRQRRPGRRPGKIGLDFASTCAPPCDRTRTSFSSVRYAIPRRPKSPSMQP